MRPEGSKFKAKGRAGKGSWEGAANLLPLPTSYEVWGTAVGHPCSGGKQIHFRRTESPKNASISAANVV